MKVFTDYIVVLLKARKAGWHRELPAKIECSAAQMLLLELP